jgi:hypothetical protein
MARAPLGAPIPMGGAMASILLGAFHLLQVTE